MPASDTYARFYNHPKLNVPESRKLGKQHYDDAIYRGETDVLPGTQKKVRHGLGVMVYASGRVYEGFWIHDKRHGRGFERFKNGDTV